MPTVFVLVPRSRRVDELFDASDAARTSVRLYPPASDRAHLLSLVRAGRDRVATRFLRGLALSIGGGALQAGIGPQKAPGTAPPGAEPLVIAEVPNRDRQFAARAS